MAKESFKRIEPHLYRRQYRTGGGEERTLYYGIMRCRLKKKSRTFPLGSNLKIARDGLKQYEARNIARDDFDLDRVKPEPTVEPERRTVAGYAPEFLKSKKENRSPAVYVNIGHLVRLFKKTPLDEIDRDKIKQYREWRRGETVTKWGTPVKSGAKIKDSTINKEISSLLDMLKTSAEKTDAKIPSTKGLKTSEAQNRRTRVLDEDEYRALLDVSPVWLCRILIFANETGLSQGDLLRLTWFEVHRKNPLAAVIKLEGGRSKNGADQIIPISPELHAVLDELEKERSKTINDGAKTLVFTSHARPINRHQLRKPFLKAMREAKIENFCFHDFRHNACSRWVNGGVEGYHNHLAMGHSLRSVNNGYTNPTDQQQYKYFAERLGWNKEEKFDEVLTGVGEKIRKVVTS